MRHAWMILFLLLPAGCKTKKKVPQRKDFTSSQVISHQKNGNSEYRFLQQKFQKDIQFYAVGNEPFWTLDMNHTLFMKFRLMDSLDIQTAAGRPTPAPDGVSTLYRAASETGELVVSVFPNECIDNMSGKRYTHEVAVRARVSPEDAYAEVKGCGRMVPDFRLHNAWMLVAMDGEAVLADSMRVNLPSLEINLEKSSVLGFGGCNSFVGSFSHQGDEIAFGELSRGSFNCNYSEMERKYLSAISGQIFQYMVSSQGVLKLLNTRHSLVFRMAR